MKERTLLLSSFRPNVKLRNKTHVKEASRQDKIYLLLVFRLFVSDFIKLPAMFRASIIPLFVGNKVRQNAINRINIQNYSRIYFLDGKTGKL